MMTEQVPVYSQYQAGKEYAIADHDASQRIPLEIENSIECGHAVRWIKEGWRLYLDNWLIYTIIGLIALPLEAGMWIYYYVPEASFLTIVSYLFYPVFFYGFFISGARVYKEKQLFALGDIDNGAFARVRPLDLLRGYLMICPLLGLGIVTSLLCGLGLILLVVPGLYLMVTLAFVPFVYIEYHRRPGGEEENPLTDGSVHEYQTLSFCECIGHSLRVVHRHFWVVTLFFIFCLALMILGYVTVLGIIVALPVTSLAVVPAFRDLFGLSHHPEETHCLCCCYCA